MHPNTLRNWDRSGKLKAVRIGARQDRRYANEDIRGIYESLPWDKRNKSSDVSSPRSSVGTPAPPQHDGGKEKSYVLKPGFSWQWVRLTFVSRKFSLFVFSVLIVGFGFAVLQISFFAYLFLAQAEEASVEMTSLQPQQVAGWEYSASALSIDLLPSDTVDAFTEEFAAYFQPLNTATEEPVTIGQEVELEDELTVVEEATTAPLDEVDPQIVMSGFVPPESVAPDAVLISHSVQISLALQADARSEDVLVVEYTVDKGELWQPLETFVMNEPFSNATHDGFLTYTIPEIQELSDIDDFQVRLSYKSGTVVTDAAAWLDGVALDIETQKPDPVTEEIVQSAALVVDEETGTDLNTDENPTITVETKKDSDFEFLGVQPTERTVKQVTITDPTGATEAATAHTADQEVDNDTTTTAVTVDTANFTKPGKYQVAVVVEQDGREEEIVYDFTWGEIALNPLQSPYQPGDMAEFSIGLVDDVGDVVCEADITTQITAPDGTVTTLSTDDGSIVQSENCYLKQEYIDPDYYGAMTVTDSGDYTVLLDATYQGATRKYMTTFSVEDAPAFTVERDGPTRIFPKVYQPMRLTVTAADDFSGIVRDFIPGDFEDVIAENGGRVVPYDTGTEIVWSVEWDVDLLADTSITFGYSFKSIEKAPALYFLGPAQVGDDWDEGRQWQVVIDATYMYLLASSSSAASGWTDYTATHSGNFVRAAASYSAAGGGSANHTHATFTEGVGAASATHGTSAGRGSNLSSDDHTHTSTGTTIAQAANSPLHYTYYLWRYDTADSTPSTVPQNTFALFKDASTPSSPWSRFAAADDDLIKIDSSHGESGSDTHSHDITWGSLNAGSGSATVFQGVGSAYGFVAITHTHTAPSSPTTTVSDTSVPQYYTYQLYEQAGTPPSVPTGMIALFDSDTLPTGWTRLSAADNLFLRSTSSSESTGGSANHSSHNTAGTSGIGGAQDSNQEAGADFALGGHTHQISLSGFANGDHTPPYHDFVVAECTSCSGGGGGIEISGTVYQSDESSNAGSGITVQVNVNGSNEGSDTTDANGAYSVTGVTASSGDIVTVYLDDHGTYEGTTVFKVDGTDTTDVDVYASAVIVRNDTGTSITNTNLESGDRDAGDDDIKFIVNTGSLVVDSGFELHIWTGDTFDPNGTVTTQGTGALHVEGTAYLDTATSTIAEDIDIDSGATLYVQDSTTVSGNDVTTSGTLNHSGGTFTIGDSTTENLVVNAGTVSLSGGTLDIKDDYDQNGGTVTVTNTVTIAGYLYLDDGTLNVNASSNIDVTGQVHLDNGGGTPILDLNGGSLDSGGHWYWNDGTINLDGGSHHTGTSSYLYFANGNTATFNMTGGDLYLGSFLIGSNAVTSTVSGGTIHIGQSGSGNFYYDIQPASHTFYSIQVDADSYFHSSSTGTMNLNGSFVISNGITFDLNSENIVTDADGDGTGGWENNGTLQIDGAETGSVTVRGGSIAGSASTTFYNLTVGGSFDNTITVSTSDQTVSGTLDVDAGDTLSIDSSRTVTLESGGSLVDDTGTFSGAGTYIHKAATVPDQPTFSVDVRIDASDNGITLDGIALDTRSFTGDVEFYINNATNTITYGAGQFFSFAGTVTLTRAGTSGTLTLEHNTNDPGIEYSDALTIGSNTVYQATNSSSLFIRGDYVNNGTFTDNSGTVTVSGSSLQTLSGTMTGSSDFNNLILTNTSGSYSGCSTSFTPGIDFAASATISGTYTITTAGVKVEYESGQTYTVGGSINWSGSSGNDIIFRNSNLTSGTWLLDAPVTQTAVSYINVARSDASAGSTVNATDGTSTDCNNNTNWVFTTTISGTAYTDEGSTTLNNSGGAIKIVNSTTGDTASDSDGTDGSGNWSIDPVIQPSDGDVLTIWIDGATAKGTLVLKYNSTDTGLSLYQDRVILRNDYSGSITNSGLADCDNDSGTNCADTEIGFTSNSGVLTTSSGRELHIWTGDSYDPGGRVVTNTTGGDLHVDDSATAYLDTATSTIGRDILVDGGATLQIQATTTVSGGDITTAGSSPTVNYSGTPTVTISGTGSIGGGATPTLSFYNLVTSGTGTTTLASAVTTAGDVTAGSGTTLDGSADLTVNGGDMTGDGTVSMSGGTTTIIGTGNFGGNTAWSLNNLTLDQEDDCANQNTTTASGTGSVTINGQLITKTCVGGVGDPYPGTGKIHWLDPSSKTWILTASGTGASRPFEVEVIEGAGGLTSGNSATFQYTGTSSTEVQGEPYYNLQLQPAGGASPTYFFYGTPSIGNDMTIGDGTNDITLDNSSEATGLTVVNTLSCTSGTSTNTVITDNATWNIGGTANLTNCDSWTSTSGHTFDFEGATPSLTSAGKTVYNITTTGTGTTTLNDAAIANGDVTVGSGTTLTGSSDLTINGGDLTGDGTITMTGGTVSIGNASGTIGGSGSDWTFQSLTFDLTGACAASYTTTATGTNNFTINSTLETASCSCGEACDHSHAFSAGSKTYTMTAAGTPLPNTITPDTSTFLYTYTGASSVTLDGRVYYNVSLQPTSDTDYTINLTANNDVTLSSYVTPDASADISMTGNGTLDGGSNTINTLSLDGAGHTVTVSNTDITISSVLGFASGQTNTLSISSGRTVSHTGAIMALYPASTISGAGTLRITNTSGGPGTGGTISSVVRYDASSGSIGTGTFDARTYGGLVELYASGGSNSITAPTSGTYTFNGGVTSTCAGCTSLTIDWDNTSDPTFDINGDLTIGATTTLQAPSTAGVFTLNGDYTNNGTFTHNSGDLELDGTSQQTVSGTLTGASGQFNDLTITNASAANPDVIFSASAQTAGTFTATTASSQLQFLAGGTYTFNNISFDGQAEGTRVFLRSSSIGTQWDLVSAGSQSVSNTNVRDSNACGGDTIDATDGTNFDATNNDCWDFNTTTFSISDADIGFGSLSATASRYATGDSTGSLSEVEAHTLIASTNADNGYIITVTGSTLTNQYGDTIDYIGGTNTAPSTGTEQFGIRLTATGGSGTVSAPYAASGFAFDVLNFPDIIASSGTESTDTTYSVRYMSNISSQTEAGSYSAGITYTMTPNF